MRGVAAGGLSPYESALAALLGTWLLLAVLAQLGPVAPWLGQAVGRLDVLGLVPRYHLVATCPATHDYHLLIRTRPPGGRFGAWREVTTEPRRRRWNAVWNPDRRHHQQLFDLAMALARTDARSDDPATPLPVPYLLLLRHVSALAGRTEGAQVQFLIARSAGHRPAEQPAALFVSQAHRTGAAAR
ncbi:hypothetical protein BLA24_25535 [Streptomyces cinnamoneus]|uniref:Uncharacterized protein n=1 Tax=Streptomyces cinnamoneus TaxID=53446 RepID=A0A2G1XDU7_STRCJ|nr:hypothetical protein [Streptomyces cinnamoneus]PHQ49410.1 hypothetical protein BLA24_25535 [Streptomyces cinnamoneus]PPT14940.1 hypothetical protein CYQ11_20540 [Streptomyces cinnamoneus]